MLFIFFFFFFKQKTAYEMRISDWSSDVCSSDLGVPPGPNTATAARALPRRNAPRAGRFRCPLRARGVNRRSARAVPPGSGRGCARRRGRKYGRSFGFPEPARGGAGEIAQRGADLRTRGDTTL